MSLKTRLYLGIDFLFKVTNKKSHKLFPFVKMVDRYVNVLLNTIYIFQDIRASALIPCARGFVFPVIPCFSWIRILCQNSLIRS